MKFRAFSALFIAALLAAVALPALPAAPVAPEGLVQTRSWNLDQLYVRPNTDLAGYRRIVIDPVQVSFRSDWNRDFVDPHASLRRLSQDDVRKIVEDTASGLQNALAETFKARGYELAAAPGPGVLRLSPSLTDLYVNAVEDLYTGGTTKSFTKDAGEATLLLDVRDAASGTLLARIVDRRTATETKGTQRGDLIRSPRLQSSFWFEDLFRKWSVACVKELEATKKS